MPLTPGLGGRGRYILREFETTLVNIVSSRTTRAGIKSMCLKIPNEVNVIISTPPPHFY